MQIYLGSIKIVLYIRLHGSQPFVVIIIKFYFFLCLQISGCITEMYSLSVILSTLNLHGDNVVSSWQRGLRRERWWFIQYVSQQLPQDNPVICFSDMGFRRVMQQQRGLLDKQFIVLAGTSFHTQGPSFFALAASFN